MSVYGWMALGAIVGLAAGLAFGTEARIAGIAIGTAAGLALHSYVKGRG